MISLKLQILLGAGIGIVLIYMINLLRKKKIEFRFALGWISIGLIVLFLTLWPIVLNMIAELMGIESPVNMLFFFGFCFALCMIFSLAKEVSHLAARVKKMSQEIAIMKKGIYENSISKPEENIGSNEEK